MSDRLTGNVAPGVIDATGSATPSTETIAAAPSWRDVGMISNPISIATANAAIEAHIGPAVLDFSGRVHADGNCSLASASVDTRRCRSQRWSNTVPWR